MSQATDYASFLIRLWRESPAQSEAASVWHGEIVHVQSGECRALDGLAPLVAFLRERSGDARLLSSTSSGKQTQ